MKGFTWSHCKFLTRSRTINLRWLWTVGTKFQYRCYLGWVIWQWFSTSQSNMFHFGISKQPTLDVKVVPVMFYSNRYRCHKTNSYIIFTCLQQNWLDIFIWNLNIYFSLHVLLFIPPFVCHTLWFSIPAVVLQNVTNKSYLVCVESEKYAFWVTFRL